MAIQLPSGRIQPKDFAEIFRLDSGGSLGKGSYGKVVRVTHLPSGKLFALKMVEKKSLEDVVKTLREIEIGMSMSHQTTCKTHCFVENDESFYIIMDFIEGCNLLQFLKDYPEVLLKNLRLLFKIIEHLLNAIEFLHSRGIVHCDIKLQNVMAQISEGSVQYIMLVDFGLSSDVRNVSKFNGGTLQYMAPEILLGNSRGFGRDIWAFGVTLFALITGKFPAQINSKNPDDKQRRKDVRKNLCELGKMPPDQLFDPFLDPERDYSEIPDEVKAFIRSCLIVNQDSRPTAADLRQRVLKILSRFEAKPDV